MSSDHRLIGGYATGNLTPEEQRKLMQAAVENQDLFDALVEEDALREALQSRQTRAEILQTLREPVARASWWTSLASPQMAVAGASVATFIAAAFIARSYLTPDQPPAVTDARNAPSAATSPASPERRDAPSGPSAPAQPERSLVRWLAQAEVNPDQSVFPLSPSRAPAGAHPSTRPLPTEFVSDRHGQAAVFGVAADSTSRLLKDWTPVESGQAVTLPVLRDGLRELRVVVLDADVQTTRDESVISALEAGRGSVFRVIVPAR